MEKYQKNALAQSVGRGNNSEVYIAYIFDVLDNEEIALKITKLKGIFDH